MLVNYLFLLTNLEQGLTFTPDKALAPRSMVPESCNSNPWMHPLNPLENLPPVINGILGVPPEIKEKLLMNHFSDCNVANNLPR